MTLYRENLPKPNVPEDEDWYNALRNYIDEAVDQEVLVPIERCEHGVEVPHGLGHQVDGNLWCRGDAVGKTSDE